MAGGEPAQRIRLDKAKADERRLIEAAQRDPTRFADVYEKYFEIVYAYIVRRVRDRAKTEDLTSEVFQKALQNLPRFKWTGAPFGAWLFRIASNTIADRAKRAARETNVSEHELTANDSSPSKQTQQSELEDCERRAHLFKMVNELANDQRSVLSMRFTEEKSIREIAGALGRSEGAVKQLQFRALTNLRKKLDTGDTEEN